MRSPMLAAWLSLLPGAGQLYTSQPRKALFFLLGTLCTIGPAILLITSGERVGLSLLQGGHSALFLIVALASVIVFLVLFVFGLFIWASAAVDAHQTAQAYNRGEPGDERRYFTL